MTFRMGENETEDGCVYEKRTLALFTKLKAIHEELQHAIVVADIDKKKIRNVVRMRCIE